MRYLQIWGMVTLWNIRWRLRVYLIDGLRDRHDRSHAAPLEHCPDDGCAELRVQAAKYKVERDRGMGLMRIVRRAS